MSALDLAMGHVPFLRRSGPPNTTQAGQIQQAQVQLLLSIELLDQSPVIAADVEAALGHVMAAASHLRSLKMHVSARDDDAPPSLPSRPLRAADASSTYASPHAGHMSVEETGG